LSPGSGRHTARAEAALLRSRHPRHKIQACPEISRFLGIAIAIYYRDHGPPHFHAVYEEFEVTVTIDGGVVSGEFPKRALRLVLEWHELHQHELA
jgi:hypothetical protein